MLLLLRSQLANQRLLVLAAGWAGAGQVVLEDVELAREKVHLLAERQILLLERLVLALELVLLVEPLVATVLGVAAVLEGAPALLELGDGLARETGHLLVELAHRVAGQLLVGQLHLAPVLEVGHDDVRARVLDVRVLVGDRLVDRVRVQRGARRMAGLVELRACRAALGQQQLPGAQSEAASRRSAPARRARPRRGSRPTLGQGGAETGRGAGRGGRRGHRAERARRTSRLGRLASARLAGRRL